MAVIVEHKTDEETGPYTEIWASEARISTLVYESNPESLYLYLSKHEKHIHPATLAQELRDLADALDNPEPVV